MLTLISSIACTAAEPDDGDVRHPRDDGEAPQQSRGEVVYGTDGRQDVYAHPDATLRARAQQSAVALMQAPTLNTTDPNNVTFNASPLRVRHDLCATERFLEDRTAAFCSGTLIDDDLVLTAGHCISTSGCPNARFVFNYYRTAADTLQTVTTADIFSCAAIVTRKQGSVDYAVVRLDRPATPRFTPAPLSTGNSALASGQNVAVMGCPSGIPFKIDSSGSVRDPRSDTLDYFVATTDTFGANSGSAVYETSSYTVKGLLVRGDTDYVANGNCNVVNTCSETGCRGEDSTYVYPALDGFCRSTNNANPRLCGNRTADFNKDGSLDVLWHHRSEDKTGIWYMRSGTLLSEQVIPGTSDVHWQPVATGDFDSDGDLDLLRHHRTRGELALWFMKGGNLLSIKMLQGPLDVNWYPVTAGDFDSDGNLDVLWHHRTQGQLTLWFMKGGNLLSSMVLQGLSNVNWYPVTAGDFDGDGDLDILWHHRTQGRIALWFMRAGVVLSKRQTQGYPNVNWYPVTAGDFNGDGSLDILWHHRTQGQLALWFMQAGTLLSKREMQGYPDVNWRPVSAGDMNGDGGMDVLWHHRTQGQLAFWFMKGGNLLSTLVRPGLSGVSWSVVR
jgi:V8-like Glu-specific endopeptidase